MKNYNVAVVGATGAVGQTILGILEERDFPVKNLLPLASSRSKGMTIKFKGEDIEVGEAKPEAFEGIDLAFFFGWHRCKSQTSTRSSEKRRISSR